MCELDLEETGSQVAGGQFEKRLSGSSREWKQATFAFRNSLMRRGANVAFEFVLPRKSVDQQIGSCVVDLINWRQIDQEEHTDHYV